MGGISMRMRRARLASAVAVIAFVAIPLVAVHAAGSFAVPAGPMPDGSSLAEQAKPQQITFSDPYAGSQLSRSAPVLTHAARDNFAQGNFAPVEATPVAQETSVPLPPPANPTVVPPVKIGDQFPPPPRPDEQTKPVPPPIEIIDAPVNPDEPPKGAVESLRDAIVASLKGNPDIQIALARQDDARFGVDEARAGYLPHVDMTVAVGMEHNDPFSGNTSNKRRSEATVTLNQNVWDFGTTINDIKRARAAYRSAQWGTREKIEAVSYDISSVYLTVLQNQKLLNLTKQEIAAHEKILKMVTIQNELGLTTPADVDRAKARLQNVQSELLDRESALQQAREAYRRLTEHLPGITVDLPSTASILPATAGEAVALIDNHSPRMAQAVEDRRSLDRQRASQTGTFFPRIGFQAQGNYKDNVQGPTNMNRDARAMVTLSYSFLNGGADIAIRNRIAARLREADYELDRRRREVEQDIRIDFNGLEAARAKISTIESEIVSAQRVVDLYRQQFREGKRSVFDLLDSQQLLFNARTNQITNMTAKTLAEYRVLQKLGGLFDLVSNGEPLPPLVVPAPGTGSKN